MAEVLRFPMVADTQATGITTKVGRLKLVGLRPLMTIMKRPASRKQVKRAEINLPQRRDFKCREQLFGRV